MMPISAIMLTVGINTYQLLGLSTSIDGVALQLTGTLGPKVSVMAGFASVFSFVVHILLWNQFFRRYKERILKMRTGRYFFRKDRFDETAGTSFIGYKTAFNVFSMGVVMTLTFLVLMALSVIGGFAKEHAESPVAPPPELAPVLQIAFPPRPAPAAFDVEVGADAYTKYADALLLRLSMPSFPPWIWWGVCGFLIQYIFNKCVWFSPASYTRNGEIRGRWLRLRFWYAVYEYLLILPNVAIGLFVILVRFIFAFVLWLYFTFSMDICLVPSSSGIEYWDAGHSAYVAVAKADHRYNNPIVMTFLASVQDELASKRLRAARLKVRQGVRRRALARKQGRLESFDQHAERVANEQERGQDGEHNDAQLSDDVEPGYYRDASGQWEPEPIDDAVGSEEILEVVQRRRRVLRRWQVARMLLVNPSMRNMRAKKLALQGVTEVSDFEVYSAAGTTLVSGVKGAASAVGEVSKKVVGGLRETSCNLRRRRADADAPSADVPAAAPPVLDADGNYVDASDTRPPWSQLARQYFFGRPDD